MNITPEALQQLIDNDPVATELFNARLFADCAVRCRELAPKVYKQTRLSRMGVIACYADDPTTAVVVLETIKAVAQANPIVSEVYAFMAPGVPESSLPDFGLPVIRSALTTPVESGGLGLTESQASPLLRASEQEDNIQSSDVERLFIIPPPPPEPEPEEPVEPEPEIPVDPIEPEPEPPVE
jgi:hypothetical protein